MLRFEDLEYKGGGVYILRAPVANYFFTENVVTFQDGTVHKYLNLLMRIKH